MFIGYQIYVEGESNCPWPFKSYSKRILRSKVAAENFIPEFLTHCRWKKNPETNLRYLTSLEDDNPKVRIIELEVDEE